jgi:predicted GIY-YIG superfamily endonuclease
MPQLLLIPDPRPLEERLGEGFFRDAPRVPGVYLMRDSADRVLYVGKAKDLHQRLQNYRIANPDRMPRQHLRMLRQVARIELQFCAGETAALRRESKLLRSLKPRFNRAGVWPGRTHFLMWRSAGEYLELAVREVPEPGWRRHGPFGGGARAAFWALARLLWLASHPALCLADLPAGWAQGRLLEKVAISNGPLPEETADLLDAGLWDRPECFAAWLEPRLSPRTHPFERAVIEEDMEFLEDFAAKHRPKGRHRGQRALL